MKRGWLIVLYDMCTVDSVYTRANEVLVVFCGLVWFLGLRVGWAEPRGGRKKFKSLFWSAFGLACWG